MICALQNGTSRSAKMRQQNRRGGKTPPPCRGELVFTIGPRSRKMVSGEGPSAQKKGAQRRSRRMDRTLSDKLDSVRRRGRSNGNERNSPRPRRRSDVIAPQCPALIFDATSLPHGQRVMARARHGEEIRLRSTTAWRTLMPEGAQGRQSGCHAPRLRADGAVRVGTPMPGGRYSNDARARPASILVCLRSEGACRDRWFVLPDGADPTARPFTGWRAEARLHA